MKVWPANNVLRKILVHPTAGKFREIGPAEWPDDSYTFRRLRDNDITTIEPVVVVQEPVPAGPELVVNEEPASPVVDAVEDPPKPRKKTKRTTEGE